MPLAGGAADAPARARANGSHEYGDVPAAGFKEMRRGGAADASRAALNGGGSYLRVFLRGPFAICTGSRGMTLCLDSGIYPAYLRFKLVYLHTNKKTVTPEA